MSKAHFALLLSEAFSANIYAESPADKVDTRAISDVVELTRAWLKAFPDGEFDTYPGNISQEFTLRLPFLPPGVQGEYIGRDTAQAVLKQTARGRSPLVFSDVTILRTEDPNLVVTTAKGEAVMNNGRIYRNEFIMLTRFRDGALVEHVEYLNPLPVIDSMKE